MSQKLIINLAPTGMVPTTRQNPSVPVTTQTIAADCAACREAGASIFHLHVRAPDESADYRGELYREVILAVRSLAPDAIICVSTSGRNFKTFEQRSEVLGLDGDAKPDMASLTVGSLNFPRQASVTDPEMIRRLADTMSERGIVPELEIFDFGMLEYAKYLIGRGILKEPFYFNLLLGSLGTLSATPFHLATLVMSLPAAATWAGAGIGAFQFFVNSMAVTMGGHVRVGLEDNLFFDTEKTKPATNEELVGRIANLARAVERPLATPAEARSIIGLPAVA